MCASAPSVSRNALASIGSHVAAFIKHCIALDSFFCGASCIQFLLTFRKALLQCDPHSHTDAWWQNFHSSSPTPRPLGAFGHVGNTNIQGSGIQAPPLPKPRSISRSESVSEVDSFLPRATYKKGLLKESRPDSLEIVQSSCLELLDNLHVLLRHGCL